MRDRLSYSLMKLILTLLFLFVLRTQSIGQENIDEIIQKKTKGVKSTIETVVNIRTCDSHGNVTVDTAKAKLSFDINKRLIFAERLYEKPNMFAIYFFENNILSSIIHTDDEGGIYERFFKQQIPLNCSANYHGGFVKAVLDKLICLTSK